MMGGSRRPWHRAQAAARSAWQQLTLAEASGAMGDLGTLLPLLVGLVKDAGLDLGTTLIFTGLYNVATGIAFGIPMPVQPMKTIAAVALSQSPLTVPQIMAAGIFVSGCVLVLGATRMFGLVNRLIPRAVIHGMQLGLGLELAKKGWQLVWYANGKAPPARQWWGPEGLFLGLSALIFTLLTIYPREQQVQPQAQQVQEGSGEEQAASGGDHTACVEQHVRDGCLPLAARPGGQAAEAGDAGGSSGYGDAVLRCDDSAELAGKAGFDLHGTWAGDGSGGRDEAGDAGLCHAMLALQRRLESVGSRVEHGLGDSAGAGAGGIACGTGRRGGASRVPAALLLVVLGILLTLAYHPEVVGVLRLGPSSVQALVPSGEDWKIGILQAGLPQLALTGLNSVVGVCQLAGQLFPDRPASPDRVAFSVGAMNLVGCWFGAMPCCHGAGGLAAQARFGATTGAAPAFLGLCKLVLGLLFGSSLLALLQAFPSPLLGAMLTFAGLELAACAWGQRGERGAAVLLLTAAVTLAATNVGVGVLAGLAAAYLLLASDSCWSEEGGPGGRPRAAAASCSGSPAALSRREARLATGTFY